MIPPKPADLSGIMVGTRLIQKAKICGVSQPVFSEWFVKEVGETIKIQPLRGLHIDCFGNPTILRKTEGKLKSKFNIKSRRIC